MKTLIIACIGIAQSIFTIFLLSRRKEIKVADKVLSVWLTGLSLLFILDIIKVYKQVTEMLWPISICVSLTFPPLLYLYTKYIIKEHTKFNKKDLLHFTPSILAIIIFAILYSTEISNLLSYIEFYDSLSLLRSITGNALFVSLWTYVVLTLFRLYQYKKQIVNSYSFESAKISLNWLLFLTIFYLIFFHIIVLVSYLQIKKITVIYIEAVGSALSLLIIYILSYCGLKQQQLSYEKVRPLLKPELEKYIPDENRYTKSGLKDNIANDYLEQLIIFMEESETWKDAELSVAKLSKLTGIPKHYITQTLNEYLHKNFYTFINEYRTEYAMKLIISPEYQNWSFLAIAYESGFNSKSAFNNFFKKYTALTPSEYKKQKSKN